MMQQGQHYYNSSVASPPYFTPTQLPLDTLTPQTCPLFQTSRVFDEYIENYNGFELSVNPRFGAISTKVCVSNCKASTHHSSP